VAQHRKDPSTIQSINILVDVEKARDVWEARTRRASCGRPVPVLKSLRIDITQSQIYGA
jgi:hypothetical protein